VNLIFRIPLVGATISVLLAIYLFTIDILNIGSPGLHAIVEALALVFIGISFMSLCFTICRGQDKYHWRMMMGVTFCLWGIEAIMPYGLAKLLVRDVVVLLFILDLMLVILEQRPNILKK